MKKKSLLTLGLALLLVLALAACGGSGDSGGSAEAEAEAPDYLGTYNMVKLDMGPLVMAPGDYDYDGCYMELREDGTVYFNDGTNTEEVPYTVDGSSFTMQEGDSTLLGTIGDDAISLEFTASDLGGEGDLVVLVMHFARADSDKEAELKAALADAGTLEEQMEAMSTDELKEFMDTYGFMM